MVADGTTVEVDAPMVTVIPTKRQMKYVLVTGGVVSGLGKGVTASSIGVVLKACGLRVTSIKIGFHRTLLHLRGHFIIILFSFLVPFYLLVL